MLHFVYVVAAVSLAAIASAVAVLATVPWRTHHLLRVMSQASAEMETAAEMLANAFQVPASQEMPPASVPLSRDDAEMFSPTAVGPSMSMLPAGASPTVSQWNASDYAATAELNSASASSGYGLTQGREVVFPNQPVPRTAEDLGSAPPLIDGDGWFTADASTALQNLLLHLKHFASIDNDELPPAEREELREILNRLSPWGLNVLFIPVTQQMLDLRDGILEMMENFVSSSPAFGPLQSLTRLSHLIVTPERIDAIRTNSAEREQFGATSRFTLSTQAVTSQLLNPEFELPEAVPLTFGGQGAYAKDEVLPEGQPAKKFIKT